MSFGWRRSGAGIGADGEVPVPGIPGGEVASIGVLFTAPGFLPYREGGVDLVIKTPGSPFPAPNLAGIARGATLPIPEPWVGSLGIVGGVMVLLRVRRQSRYGRRRLGDGAGKVLIDELSGKRVRTAEYAKYAEGI